MLNVKKSILSLLREKKEQLYAIRQKRQKRSEKNLQSTAKGKGFLFSRPQKEIDPCAKESFTDEQIFEMMGRIEFNFGGEIHTVEESKLLFAYEVVTDLSKPYVIALSEKYGAIVFELSEEVINAVKERLRPDESPGIYISDLIERQAAIRSLSQVHSAGVRSDVAADVISALANFGIGCEAAGEALIELSRALHESGEKKEKPNNWLKMHGYPMRRKRGKGK